MPKVTVIGLALVLSVTASFGASTKRRMSALPDYVYKKVIAEEANLNNILGGCHKAANPKSCRSEAITAHGKKVSGILAPGGRGLKDTSTTKCDDCDCTGDSEATVTANCSGGKVEKIDVPCGPCKYVRASGCFIYACIKVVK